MIELTKEEVEKLFAMSTQEGKLLILFFYTPLCGTCKVTEKMLQIVLELSPGLPIYKCNINLMPSFAQVLQMQSVPCILICQEGKVAEKLYSMRNIEYLYQILISYQ